MLKKKKSMFKHHFHLWWVEKIFSNFLVMNKTTKVLMGSIYSSSMIKVGQWLVHHLLIWSKLVLELLIRYSLVIMEENSLKASKYTSIALIAMILEILITLLNINHISKMHKLEVEQISNHAMKGLNNF